ncbi:MAG: magnesium transporter CorA family protein [Rhodoferax sp.]
MLLIAIAGGQIVEQDDCPPERLNAQALPAAGMLWLSCTRDELAQHVLAVQAALRAWCGVELLDLHLSDLLNPQLPSTYDYTTHYDVLVFRRLAQQPLPAAGSASAASRHTSPSLPQVETHPVGFAVFDRVLLSVHSADASLRDAYVQRLLLAARAPEAAALADARSVGARGVPSHPADLMLRMISQMVDGFLALRRSLSQQLEPWQTALLAPRGHVGNWGELLAVRQTLHTLDDVCDDQTSALQAWMAALASTPLADAALDAQQRDGVQVRCRDVLEHIERVARHVRQLEHNVEAAVQIHFSMQSHRTNEIMRTLTALTAVFLPLNLVTGIFGMNFEFIPLLHQNNGFWWALGGMALTAGVLLTLFWRKRYLARIPRVHG